MLYHIYVHRAGALSYVNHISLCTFKDTPESNLKNTLQQKSKYELPVNEVGKLYEVVSIIITNIFMAKSC